jgi:hypothetical protein
MRSKWLNWRPGDEVSPKSADPKATELTELSSVSSVSSADADSSIINTVGESGSGQRKDHDNKKDRGQLPKHPEMEVHADQSRTELWSSDGDYYGWRLNAALEFICSRNYPSGLIPWVQSVEPYLYNRLTHYLPDEISIAWNSRASFDAFDALCCELEDMLERAAELHHRHNIQLPRKSPSDET